MSKWIKFYAAEILTAVEACHEKNILYRDLKLENIVVDKNGHIKLVDFGFSKKLKAPDFRTFTNCGTFGYTAPELL